MVAGSTMGISSLGTSGVGLSYSSETFEGGKAERRRDRGVIAGRWGVMKAKDWMGAFRRERSSVTVNLRLRLFHDFVTDAILI